METVISQILLFGVLPAWILAVWMDWICHRMTGMAYGDCTRETVLHLLMAAEIAAAALLVALLQANALVLILLVALWLAYQFTLMADARFAAPRRIVSALERRVHRVLGILSTLALALLCVFHGDQWLAMTGAGTAVADVSLTPRTPPLPYLSYPAIFGAVGLLILPFAEELWRGLRADRIDDPTPATQGRSHP